MMKNTIAILLVSSAVLSGCGVVAAPCRISSTALKMVPVVGHPAALPTDACAEIIDPGPRYLRDEDRKD
jgi:hypothetical protein